MRVLERMRVKCVCVCKNVRGCVRARVSVGANVCVRAQVSVGASVCMWGREISFDSF